MPKIGEELVCFLPEVQEVMRNLSDATLGHLYREIFDLDVKGDFAMDSVFFQLEWKLSTIDPDTFSLDKGWIWTRRVALEELARRWFQSQH